MPNLDHRVADRLALHGVRLTPTRRRVLEALLEAPGPMAATDLAGSLDSVPLSSLYRTLSVLGAAGVVCPHHAPDGLTRYEPAEWLAGHHHHLYCVECGTIVDFELSAPEEASLDVLTEEVARRNGFMAEGHALEVEGRCPGCRDA